MADTSRTADGRWPSVTAVIATRGRAELLRRAVRSIATQDYEGTIEVVVVYDQCDVDELSDLREEHPGISLVTTTNSASPGLAGGRNTGIGVASGELIAFCDDDDEWTPDKLAAQVRLWDRAPSAVGVSSGMKIVTQSGEVIRTPPPLVTHEEFFASRVPEIHPSSFLFRRSDLCALPGGVDEGIPYSYGEDYDLLLRLTSSGPIVSVQEPLVVIHWDRVSYFAGRWNAMAGGLAYLLAKHPRLYESRRNAARMCGQIAFAQAASGDMKSARVWAKQCLRRRPTEPRGWLTLAAMTRVVKPERIIAELNKRGRGI